MKEKDSQGKKGGDWKKTLGTILFLILAIVLIAFVAIAIYFAVDYWWSDYTVNDPPPPLEVAIAVLSILVTVFAIFMALITWSTRKDWEKFKEDQVPIINDLRKGLDELKREQKEIQWIKDLRDQVIQTDPYLRKPESQNVVKSIDNHYHTDQDIEAWKMYGVGRSLDIETNYKEAIKYYDKAIEISFTDSNLKLHTNQSLGIVHFQMGRRLEDDGDNGDAIKEYELAIKYYDLAIGINKLSEEAHNNKGITLIQLGKIEDKPEYYKQAISCLEKVIEIEDNYDHHYDKARAHALLNQRNKAIESLTRAFKLVNPEKLGKLLKHLTDDLEDFRNVQEQEEFKALVKRYTDILKGNN